MNSIDYICPVCGCQKVDVLAIMNGKVIVRCLGTGKNHQFPVDHTKNSQWERFFKPEKIKEIKDKTTSEKQSK